MTDGRFYISVSVIVLRSVAKMLTTSEAQNY